MCIFSAKRLIQICQLDTKVTASFNFNEDVDFLIWKRCNLLVFVTKTSVFHLNVQKDLAPQKMFDRHPLLDGCNITGYCTDSKQRWFSLFGAAETDGAIQLYSTERKTSQAFKGNAASLATIKLGTNVIPSTLFIFVNKSKLHISELASTLISNNSFTNKTASLTFDHTDACQDFPVSLIVSEQFRIIYLITKYGNVIVHDIETAKHIVNAQISMDPILFTSLDEIRGKILIVNSRGSVLAVAVNIPHLIDKLQDPDLAQQMAIRHNFPGSDHVLIRRFNDLFRSGQYIEAVKLAALASNDSLRSPEIIERLKKVERTNEVCPLLFFFGMLLDQGKLNKYQSLQLCQLILSQNKDHRMLCEGWFQEDKLHCSEELGDLFRHCDISQALLIYLRANAHNKVIECYLESGQFNDVIVYANKYDCHPNYMLMLRSTMESNQEKGIALAKYLVYNEPLRVDISRIIDIFIEYKMSEQITTLLLDKLKQNVESEGPLQTRILEISLLSTPKVASNIIQTSLFKHYDQKYIANQCENVGLLERALELYTDIRDVKRIISKSDRLKNDYLQTIFGRLSEDDFIECLQTMLSTNIQMNLQKCVQIVIKHHQKLDIRRILLLFEQFESFEGIFLVLSSVVKLNQDPEVHFKYIQAAHKTNNTKALANICTVSNSYDPERVKKFLMEVDQNNLWALFVVCNRFNFVDDLLAYLFKKKLEKYIQTFVMKINPCRLPVVVDFLLNMNYSEELIMDMISAVNDKFSKTELILIIEKHKRLQFLVPWLKLLIANDCTDTDVHNALAKAYIDAQTDPETFLEENKYYDSVIIAEYCEERYPTLAYIAYKRCELDKELIKVCNNNSLFKQEAQYLIHRQNAKIWMQVLSEQNCYRQQLIDAILQVITTEADNSDGVLVTINAFKTIDLPQYLTKLLETVFFNPAFSSFKERQDLQNLLLLTAIQTKSEYIMTYILELENFDGYDIAHAAINNALYNEAFAICKKFKHNSLAVQVLLENIKDLERAQEFAVSSDEPAVWYLLANAQFEQNMVEKAIESYIKSKDLSSQMKVVEKATEAKCWSHLCMYLEMVCKQDHENEMEDHLIYAYAQIGSLTNITGFISTPNHVNLEECANRCFNDFLYNAAEILYRHAENFSGLAKTLVQLKKFRLAVGLALRTGSLETVELVCFACIDSREIDLAKKCGLYIIAYAKELNDIVTYYENNGLFRELIALFEESLKFKSPNNCKYNELAIIYCNHDPSTLREYFERFWSSVNISKVKYAVESTGLWFELEFLYFKHQDYNNAVLTMLNHPSDAWEKEHFKEAIVNVTDSDLYYKAVQYYMNDNLLLLNDLLLLIASQIKHTRLINIVRDAGKLEQIKSYLCSVQGFNDKSINEAINELLIIEENHQGLNVSIENHDNFNSTLLAEELENNKFTEFRQIAARLYKGWLSLHCEHFITSQLF